MMKSYYEELDRFAREAGIKDIAKKDYCQFFTEMGGVSGNKSKDL